MHDWISKSICRKFKTKGHVSLNCPPKYKNKPYITKNELKNREEHVSELAANRTEFSGSTTHNIPNQRIFFNYKSPPFAYNYHLEVMEKVCKHSPNLANINFRKLCNIYTTMTQDSRYIRKANFILYCTFS